MRNLLKRLGRDVTNTELDVAFRTMDLNRSYTVGFSEFERWWREDKDQQPASEREAGCSGEPPPEAVSLAFTMFAEARSPPSPAMLAIQKGTRVLISLWDSLMFGRCHQVPGATRYPPEH